MDAIKQRIKQIVTKIYVVRARRGAPPSCSA